MTHKRQNLTATATAATTAATATATAAAAATTTAIKEKNYPFFAPVPKFPNWRIDKACAESNYLILHKGEKVQDDPFTDPKIPVMFFAANVLQEVNHIVRRQADITGECGGFFLIRKLNDADPHWLAYDFFMPGQEASTGEVDLDGKDLQKYLAHLRETYPTEFGDNVHLKLAHWHSHGKLGAFFSTTDDNQQFSRSQLGFQADYRFYFTFNKAGDIHSAFVSYYPLHFRVTDISLGIYFGDPQYVTSLTRERKKELDNQCDQLISQPRRNFTAAFGGLHPARGRAPAPTGYLPAGGMHQSMLEQDRWVEHMYGKSYPTHPARRDESSKSSVRCTDWSLGGDDELEETRAMKFSEEVSLDVIKEQVIAHLNAYLTLYLEDISPASLPRMGKGASLGGDIISQEFGNGSIEAQELQRHLWFLCRALRCIRPDIHQHIAAVLEEACAILHEHANTDVEGDLNLEDSLTAAQADPAAQELAGWLAPCLESTETLDGVVDFSDMAAALLGMQLEQVVQAIDKYIP